MLVKLHRGILVFFYIYFLFLLCELLEKGPFWSEEFGRRNPSLLTKAADKACATIGRGVQK